MYPLSLPRKARPMPLAASPDGEYALGWGRARSGSRGLRDSHRLGTATVRNVPDSKPVMPALFTTTSARRISRASTSQSFLLLNIDAQEAAAGFVRGGSSRRTSCLSDLDRVWPLALWYRGLLCKFLCRRSSCSLERVLYESDMDFRRSCRRGRTCHARFLVASISSVCRAAPA